MAPHRYRSAQNATAPAAPLWRTLLPLLLILVLGTGFFLWFGVTFLPNAMDKTRREIVNDEYGYEDEAGQWQPLTTQPLAAGGEIRQQMYVMGRLEGVWLKVGTLGRVARGTLHLALEAADGSVVARGNADMALLKDGEFHSFLFEERIEAGRDGGWYTLVLTSSSETAEDTLVFHRSGGPVAGYFDETFQIYRYDVRRFRLSQNGQSVEGTLALQYVVRAARGFIVKPYAFFAAFLTVLAMGLYYLFFARKTALHRVFLVAVLGLGFVFLFLIPPGTAPDEYAHISTAYKQANDVLGLPPTDYDYLLFVRPGDEMVLHRYNHETGTDIFAWQDLYEGLFSRDPGGEPIAIQASVLNLFPPLYFLQALGVLLARLLGLGRVPLLLLGRLFNLLFYAIVVSRAVKRMPFAPALLAVVALLPSCLQLAASFSYDAELLAIAFYFTAYALSLAFPAGGKNVAAPARPGKAPHRPTAAAQAALPAHVAAAAAGALQSAARGETEDSRQSAGAQAPPEEPPAAEQPGAAATPMGKAGAPAPRGALGAPPAGRPAVWQLCALVGLLLLLVPAKGLYVLLGGLVLLIPARRLFGRDLPLKKYWPLLLAAGLVLALALVAVSAGALARIFDVPIDNSEQAFSLGYMLGHLPKTLRMLGRSFWQQSGLWLQGLLGSRLGEIIALRIEINPILQAGLLLAVLAAVLPTPQDNFVLGNRARLWVAALCAAVLGVLLVVCASWTPASYTELFGMQGRYLLPVLPAALVALRGKLLKFTRESARPLVFGMAVLVSLVCTDAFRVILAF